MCGKGESSLSGQGLPMALPLQLHTAADAVDAINQLVLFVDREDIFLYNKLIQMKQLVGTIVDQSLGRGGMRCAPVVSGMANVW